MTASKKRPVYPIHPGTILGDELTELSMNAAELARELHVPSNRLYQLIAGKRAMTADTALRLEQWLGVEAAFWMNLQKTYELDCAAEEIGEEIRRTIPPAGSLWRRRACGGHNFSPEQRALACHYGQRLGNPG